MTTREGDMKKRIITVIVAAFALLAVTGSAAAALPTWESGSGVLVRHDDGYIITGTLRDADSQVVGTIHGTLVERTTGFNSCPLLGSNAANCVSFFSGVPLYHCNLLGGQVTLNFQGSKYDTVVNGDNIEARVDSALCKDADDPTIYGLWLFMWTTSDPPDVFTPVFARAEQISPNVWKWSS
jgi:hypothetical protein